MTIAALPYVSPQMLSDLRTFLRIPSISSDGTYSPAVSACAQWLSDYLLQIGLPKAGVYQTAHHPVVCAEYMKNSSYPTILFYGHYDVQPPGNLQNWNTPPFEPIVENGHLYGRGAADDKGQIFIQLKAIEYVIRNYLSFPVNIRCLFEGAEEIGSPGLAAFLKKHPDKIQADVVMICDTKMYSAEIPAITYSLRGALNAEIVIGNSHKELHAGTYGGIVHNPAETLSALIASLQDQHGIIQIDGFYNDVILPTRDERRFMQTQGPPDGELIKSAGIKVGKREPGYSLYEQTTIRPSLTIAAMKAGHTDGGIKNIIPSTAMARIAMRLVGHQSPKETAKLLAEHVRQALPSYVKYKLRFSSMAEPVETKRRHPYVTAAARACTQVFQRTPVFLRSGGTIPVAGILSAIMTAPVILMGFALPEDNLHAANERFSLLRLQRGIETLIAFIKNISAYKKD